MSILNEILETKFDKNELDPLLFGDCNWNFFKDKKSNTVYAIAKKGSGASHCIFGDINYFKRWLLKELKKDSKLELKITKKDLN